MNEGEKTPGQEALSTMRSLHADLVFKHPNPPARKHRPREKILDEDTYIDQIDKIIQRDFFPDLEKLQAQNEYLDATEKNDTVKMRQLFMKYNAPPTQRLPSPATFETPARPAIPVEPVAVAPPEAPKLSLDEFLAGHTSQDNQSFNEIIAEMEAKHRDKYAYLYQSEESAEMAKNQQLALPDIEAQALLAPKPFNIDTWTYTNRNYIMYTPGGATLTPEEQLEAFKKRQEVVHVNTRLKLNPFNENQSKETISELARTQSRVLDGKIGVDGKELVKETPKMAGFGFVKTPSPGGALGTPLMTWGEVEGTPFRLDESPRAQGPAFKMSEPPRREQLALALAEKVGVRNRDRKMKAMEAARRRFASPSPRGNYSERLATMSPAARSLGGRLARGGGRATPSPMRVGTPKLSLGIRRGDDHLTDDLLQIELPKRQKAADFF